MAGGEKGLDRRVGTAGSQPPRTGEELATSGEDKAPKSSRWRMGNWRLRTKLLVVLVIPSLAALALGASRVVVDYNNANVLASNSEQVRLDAAAVKTAFELQFERDLTSLYLASGGSLKRPELDRQRQVVDRAIGEFQAEIAQVEEGSHPAVAERFSAAAAHLDRLQSLRTVADGNTYPPDASYRAYSDSVNSLLDLGEQGITRINQPELLRQYLATNAMARAQEAESTKRALLGEALARGFFQADAQRSLLAADAELDAALSDFRTWATPQQRQTYDDTVAGQDVDNARTIEATALVRGDDGQRLDGLDANQWFNVSSTSVRLTNQVTGQLRNELQTQVNNLANTARFEMIAAVSLVIGALALAFLIASLVARSLLLPLRTLRRSALEVADRRLPEAVESILHDPNPDVARRARVEPIPVHTTEEIGRVARSFDAVHTQALRLASEQALLRNNVNDLFVNLARRSQTLVQRQLSLIDRLEQDEQDPDQLSSLFELDHLATRMRRNNENLLILGGTDLTRRMMRPVSLSEVLGAAVSEVEQYARIVVADTPELAIQGRVVNDFVHLVAELLENATVFSNPDTEVTVRTAYRRQELVVEIRDRGVGIDATELQEINERLTRPPEVDVSISRRMGLYVVGQLARRHNIQVMLQNNGDLEGGVTATVHLAGEYVSQLTADGPVPMPDVQQRGPGEERDPLTETGSHAGLAAAFGRNDGVAERSRPEPAGTPTAFVPQPSQSTENYLPTVDSDFRPVDNDDVPADYSFQVSSGDQFGVTDIPQWNGDGPSWPSEEIPELRQVPAEEFDGQCGEPPGLDGTANLFESPFEAEKTATFGQPSENGASETPNSGWDSAPASAEADDSGGYPPLGASAPPRDHDDAPTERLPIYEAVLSQWFRESDDTVDPVADGAAENGRSTGFPTLSDTGSGVQDSSPLNGTAERGAAETSGVDRDAMANANGSAQPSKPETTAAGLPKRTPPDPGWGSADVGWQAAEALAEQSKQVQETTAAGLPKRVPKSNLVPGSAAPRQQSSVPRRPATTRSPDAVRGRMSSFQQGIRRGRHAKAEPVSTEQPNSLSSRHEEQE